MTLRDYLIRNSLPAASPEEIQKRLSEEVEIFRDSRRQTITDVASAIGFVPLLALSKKLKGTDLEPLMLVVQSGCRFDDPETIKAIQLCASVGMMTREEAGSLLSLGIRTGPAWQKEGFAELPSVDEIKTAQAQIGTEQLREVVAAKYQAVRAAIDEGKVLTVKAAVAMFADAAVVPGEERI